MNGPTRWHIINSIQTAIPVLVQQYSWYVSCPYDAIRIVSCPAGRVAYHIGRPCNLHVFSTHFPFQACLEVPKGYSSSGEDVRIIAPCGSARIWHLFVEKLGWSAVRHGFFFSKIENRKSYGAVCFYRGEIASNIMPARCVCRLDETAPNRTAP